MVNQTIKIYTRVKPSIKSKTGVYDVFEDEDINFLIPRDVVSGFVNNKKENHKFRFEHVFNQKSKQDEIFDVVAQPVIDNVLEGYNGTIFAYGQTGSGKTFTITGGAERYIDRGIIPRSLSYIFQQIQKQSEFEYTMHISYLEIYNENGYDLLNPKHEASKLEDLPKVTLREDSDQNIHLMNLTVHQTGNEEDALNLLFLGDTNRMIAETPMNQASTRSHCVFTIHLTSRLAGSATIRRAKLHLVDLAGSERVSKTGTSGVLLTEAKYINLSLHYLEQVIIALSEKTRSHIPYRNSMMTSVLRDSLGGNCMTTMIATISVEKTNIEESVSTCRFAQRVALIKNEAVLNEELDPLVLIAKLKQEIVQLKDELALLTGEQRSDELTEEEKTACAEAVNEYLANKSTDAMLNVGADMRKIQYSFSVLKKMIANKIPLKNNDDEVKSSDAVDTGPYANSQLSQLKQLIEQRDTEINILVNMLKKEKNFSLEADELLGKHGLSVTKPKTLNGVNGATSGRRPKSDTTVNRKADLPPLENSENVRDEQRKQIILGDMSLGRKEGFDIFRQDYEHNVVIEENKRLLKRKFAEAKKLGEEINESRTSINKIKGQIEQHRMALVMQGLVDPSNCEADDTEINLRHKIDSEKVKYKGKYTVLKGLKTEIEHIQHLLDKSKVKLLKDFELWWAEQITIAQERRSKLQPCSGINEGMMAWKSVKTPQTPPIMRDAQTESKTPPRHDTSHNTTNISPESRQSPDLSSNAYFAKPVQSAGDSRSSTGGDLPLTGDSQVDADIIAFVNARRKILQNSERRF